MHTLQWRSIYGVLAIAFLRWGFHNSDSGSYYDDGTVIASDIGESNDYTRSDGVYSFDYAESHKVGT